MFKLGLFKKLVSVTANFSLLLNSFLPFILATQPVLAQSVEPLRSKVEYNQSTHNFHIEVNTNEKVNYQLVYKTDKQIESVTANEVSGDPILSRDIYAGTCSDKDCTPHNIKQGILKVQVPSQNWIYSQLFDFSSSSLQIFKEEESPQYDLTDEENEFLENGQILGDSITSTPTPTLTSTVTPIPKVEQVCLTDNQTIRDSVAQDWNRDDTNNISETTQKVQLGVKYNFPQEEKVSVTFTCLPKDENLRTTLKIQQVKSSDLKLPDNTNVGEYAYDITTGMTDGDFEYNITLPKSAESTAEISYIEKSLNDAKNNISADEIKPVEDNKIEQQSETVKAISLDHFTIFMVTANDTVNENDVGHQDRGWISDNNYAVFDEDSDWAEYGFPDEDIPIDSTINGIEILIEGYADSSRDFEVALWNTSNNPDAYTSKKTADISNSDAIQTLGGPTDLWGKTWTPSDFADATFKIRIDADNDNGTAYLDHVELKVYYTEPTPPVTNPPLSQSCGIDIGLIIDTSTSIDDGELSTMKSAFNNFVDSFVGTPTRMAVVSFDDSAVLRSGFTDNLSSVKTTINGINGDGYTNWEDALLDTRNLFPDRTDKPDLIVFTSDGNPTASSAGANDTNQPNAHLTPAIVQANAAKNAGIRIISLGIGNDVNASRLQQISSADAYYSAANFSDLEDTLHDLVTDLCGGTITVRKMINGNPSAPLNNWQFTVNGQNYSTGSNGYTDSISVTSGTYSVVETQKSGYSLNSAVCIKNTNGVGSTITNGVGNIAISSEDIVSCTFTNDYLSNCGDGILSAGEECDKAINGTVCIPAYGIGSTCTYCGDDCKDITLTGPYCGDGVKNSSEECDDGNDNDTDLCNNSCIANHRKITLCHATPVDTAANGWNEIEIDDDGIEGEAHDSNHGADIIPAFDYYKNGTFYSYAGKNLDSTFFGLSGQQILDNGCKVSSTLKVVKSVDNTGGGLKSASDFRFSLNGASYTNFGIGGSNVFNLNIGDTYSVVENTEFSNIYSVSFDNCSGTINSTQETCTITNTYIPYCGDGVQYGSEQCDDGNTDNTDSCTNGCYDAVCGDGYVQAGEECDDANLTNNDACTNSCTLPKCGDGILNQISEQCDDGNTVNTDTCLNTCQSNICGDGFVNSGVEECDDHNTVNHDGCNNICKTEYLITFDKQVTGGTSKPSDWSFNIDGYGNAVHDNDTVYFAPGYYSVTESGPAHYVFDNASGDCVKKDSGGIELAVSDTGSMTCQISNIYQGFCGDGIKNQDSEQCDGSDGVTPGQNFCAPKTCKLIPIYDGSHTCSGNKIPTKLTDIPLTISSTNATPIQYFFTGGKEYLLKVLGTYSYNKGSSVYKADSAYATNNSWSSTRSDVGIWGTNKGVTSILGDLGSGMGVIEWDDDSTVDSDHIYEKSFDPSSDITAKFVISDWYSDWYGQYQNQSGMSDNDGSLQLDVYECQEPPAKIYAQKVVCDNESYLPNNTQGNITASTAQDWVNNSGGHCKIVDNWNFQYGGVGSYGAFQTNTNPLPSWQTITTTSGVAMATIKDLSSYGSKIEVREVFPDNTYIPFSNSSSNVSAEIYCTGDAANYDNWEWINNPQYGQNYYCVAFNAVKTGSITFVKDANPDSSQSFHFTYGRNDYPLSDFDLVDDNNDNNSEMFTFNGIPGGIYSWTESDYPDWDLTDITCSDSNSTWNLETKTINVNLEPGEDVTCTVTNTQKGKIIIAKQTSPDGSRQSFEFNPSWSARNFSLTDGQTNDSGWLVSGTYSVSEVSQTGWDLDSATCVSSNEDTETIDNISLQSGETVTCTFNNIQRASVTVYKFNDLNGNGTKDEGENLLSNWTINLTGQTSINTDENGQANFSNLVAGSYDLSENLDSQPGWKQTNIYCENSGPGVKITKDGEAYGHHGWCNGWNECKDAATCALWACHVRGYSNLVSYGEGKPCTDPSISNCHLFQYGINSEPPVLYPSAGDYTDNRYVDYDWGRGCEVSGVTDIVCSNGSSSNESYQGGYISGNHITLTPGQTRTCYIGNQRLKPKITIAKSNNTGGANLTPGSSVQYKISLKFQDNNVKNLKVTDLLSNGFVYQPGSYKVFKTTGSVTSNITHLITEPQYHSPGVWDLTSLGDLTPEDTIELIYNADISDNQLPGKYADLAWAGANYSYDAEKYLLAQAQPEGYVATNFVGTKVPIVASYQSSTNADIEREVEGQVLGASTEMPSTGSATVWLIISTILAALGFVFIKSGKISRLMAKRSILTILLTLLSFSLLVKPILASDLVVRLEEPKSPTNTKDLNIKFVALDIQGRGVTVYCLKKGPSDSAFSQFSSEALTNSNGNSSSCDLSTAINEDGTYQFQVKAVAGGDEDYSNIVNLDYNSSTPDTPGDYRKEKPSDCEYKIHFKTAADNDKTVRVEVYRSDLTSFIADNGSKVGDITVGSDQERDFFNSVPDCSKDYYYVLRAFNVSGNGSGLIGDSVEVTTSSITTTSTSSSPTTGAIPVTGQVINTGEEIQEEESTTPEDENGQILGSQNSESQSFFVRHKFISSLLIIVALAIIVYAIKKIFKNKTGKKRR